MLFQQAPEVATLFARGDGGARDVATVCAQEAREILTLERVDSRALGVAIPDQFDRAIDRYTIDRYKIGKRDGLGDRCRWHNRRLETKVACGNRRTVRERERTLN